jgi:heme o synthase
MIPHWFRSLLIGALATTLVAIVSGAFVTAYGAGAACAGWPFCSPDSVTLPTTAPAWLAFSHRIAVVIAGFAMLALALAALRLQTLERAVRLPLLLAPLLAVATLPLDWLMVRLQLFDLLGVNHLASALILLGCQLVPWVALSTNNAQLEQRLGGRASKQARGYTTLAWWAAGATLVLTLAASALPAASSVRLAGFAGLSSHGASALLVAAVLVGGLGLRTWQQRRNDRLLLTLSVLVLFLLLIEGLLLFTTAPAVATTVGTLLWGTSLLLATLAARRPIISTLPVLPVAQKVEPRPSLLNDYLSLTKPKVISLLLVTTLAAMFITENGTPSFWLVFWTMIGGYLAAGGAGAINCAFDSDIDVNMGRTSRRPVPSGRISRQAAMRFGLILSILSAIVMLVFTTPLAMLLSTLGILYYAVFYTQWLKRSTWQNIVIGGGAGSLPPLVGWTAVTGTLSLPAVLLFAIIFYWTPPHFWALALVKEKDYARAGVPMLPVVAGAGETRYQILVYSLILVALSVLLTPLGAMGWIYLLGALILGGLFLRDAWNVYRYGEQQHIWQLYKYSLLYLALLFAVMVVDRVVL